jgi:hypothetical protein
MYCTHVLRASVFELVAASLGRGYYCGIRDACSSLPLLPEPPTRALAVVYVSDMTHFKSVVQALVTYVCILWPGT